MTQETFLFNVFCITIAILVAFVIGFIKGSSFEGLPKFNNPPPPPIPPIKELKIEKYGVIDTIEKYSKEYYENLTLIEHLTNIREYVDSLKGFDLDIQSINVPFSVMVKLNDAGINNIDGIAITSVYIDDLPKEKSKIVALLKPQGIKTDS